MLHSAWPLWREAAIEQRPGPPRVLGASWRVEALHGASALAAPAEPALLLTLHTAAPPRAGGEGGLVQREVDVPLALNSAALGSLLVGMRRVKDGMEKVAGAAR